VCWHNWPAPIPEQSGDRPSSAHAVRATAIAGARGVLKLTVSPFTLRLREPLVTSWGTLTERRLLRTELDPADGAGVIGVGEAAPLEPYDGVPLAAVRAALDAYASVLAGIDDPEAALEACRAERDLPQALAAVDLALWDLAGRRTGRPVAHLLSVEAARSIPANATVGGVDRASAFAAGAAARAAEFDTIKVKVGVGDDAGRLAAVRAGAGPRMAIRIDANGAWTEDPDVAAATLRALAPVGLEFCEEPVHGVEALRAVRAEVDVPIAMDETAGLETDAAGSGATDAVCLKISRCGGITGVVRDAALARVAGSTVYLASTYDGPVGLAAAVHVAAGLTAGGPLPAHGLATLDAFDGELVGPRAVRGAIRVARAPGLGVD
jgi:L-alanine-DL-glutamate epimerase-like enolase superfamily enzyme